MDRDALLKQLTLLDFMAVDLGLYLNTHPDDAEALRMYNDVIESQNQSRQQYERFSPLTSFRCAGGPGWTWKDCPWPWQASFNYEQSGEGCF